MVVSFIDLEEAKSARLRSSRYAKNAVGQVGVIPENYVETLADPPEPQEPPPLMTTFSHSSTTSPPLYPSSDIYHNTNRTSYPDPPHYMNPMAIGNSWQNSSADSYNARPVSAERFRSFFVIG